MISAVKVASLLISCNKSLSLTQQPGSGPGHRPYQDDRQASLGYKQQGNPYFAGLVQRSPLGLMVGAGIPLWVQGAMAGITYITAGNIHPSRGDFFYTQETFMPQQCWDWELRE